MTPGWLTQEGKPKKLTEVQRLVCSNDGPTAAATIMGIHRQKCPIDLNNDEAIRDLAIQLIERLKAPIAQSSTIKFFTDPTFPNKTVLNTKKSKQLRMLT